MNIPSDPIMLMSLINTQLRDKYPSFDELIFANMWDKEAVIEKLKNAGYGYSEEKNQFVKTN